MTKKIKLSTGFLRVIFNINDYGFYSIKEWAYAGLCFDLLGASYSTIAIGDTISSIAPALIGLILLTLSYIFYHKKNV